MTERSNKKKYPLCAAALALAVLLAGCAPAGGAAGALFPRRSPQQSRQKHPPQRRNPKRTP